MADVLEQRSNVAMRSGLSSDAADIMSARDVGWPAPVAGSLQVFYAARLHPPRRCTKDAAAAPSRSTQAASSEPCTCACLLRGFEKRVLPLLVKLKDANILDQPAIGAEWHAR
jgi:hypothetical protein